MTVRALETLIRLSTAHAKARLSQEVAEEDAIAAEEILRYALYKEVVKATKNGAAKRRKLNKPKRGDKGSGEESSEDEAESSDDDVDDGRGPKRMDMPGRPGTRTQPARGARNASARGSTAAAASSPAAFSVDGEEDYMLVEQGQADADADDDEEAAMREAEGLELPSPPLPAVAQAAQVEQAPTPEAGVVDPARFKLFQSRLAAVRKSDAFKDTDELTLDELMEPLNGGLEIAQLFGRAEVEELLSALAAQDDAVITFDAGVLYF